LRMARPGLANGVGRECQRAPVGLVGRRYRNFAKERPQTADTTSAGGFRIFHDNLTGGAGRCAGAMDGSTTPL